MMIDGGSHPYPVRYQKFRHFYCCTIFSYILIFFLDISKFTVNDQYFMSAILYVFLQMKFAIGNKFFFNGKFAIFLELQPHFIGQ